MPLIDPVYRIRPNRYDGVRRSWDPLGELGLQLEHIPAQVTIIGQEHSLEEGEPSGEVLTLSHLPAEIVIEGQQHTLREGLTWVQEPPIAFIEGVADTYDLLNDVSDPERAQSFGIEEGELPEGITLTGEKNNLVTYDGVGSADVSEVKFYVEDDAAELDWLERISGPGVVWYHDFRSDAEVDQFRWTGGYGNDPEDVADPGKVYRDTTDGITGGGCLRIDRPAGTSEGPTWWRPFCPISGAQNGRGQDDPGANGSIPLVNWNSSSRSQNEQHFKNYYAHPSYHGEDGWDESDFDGTEFYIQFWAKVSTGKLTAGSVGKLAMIQTTKDTPNQELVINSPSVVGSGNRNGIWQWYTNIGSSPNVNPTYAGGALKSDTGQYQPGGPYDGKSPDGNGSFDDAWKWVEEEWVNFLIHVIPGRDDVGESVLEVFVCRYGQNEYETLFSVENGMINYSANGVHPFGYNALRLSAYHNGINLANSFSQKYDQVIFSLNPIPCPQV